VQTQHLIDWIYNTSASNIIRKHLWMVPVVQAIHICAIAIVVSSALVSELRIAGLIATDETPTAVVRRYLPWMWSALAVLLLSGAILVWGEPERSLTNTTFWLKMSLVLIGVVLSVLFRKPLLDPDFIHRHPSSARLIKPVAWLSLCLWIVVIFSGRWIAYTR